MIQEYDDLVQRTEDALHACLYLAVQHGQPEVWSVRLEPSG